jgi:hypothetical protein
MQRYAQLPSKSKIRKFAGNPHTQSGEQHYRLMDMTKNFMNFSTSTSVCTDAGCTAAGGVKCPNHFSRSTGRGPL